MATRTFEPQQFGDQPEHQDEQRIHHGGQQHHAPVGGELRAVRAVDGVREHEHRDEHVEQQRTHAVQRRLTIEPEPYTSVSDHQHDQESDQLANHDTELPHAHSSRLLSRDFLSLVHIGSHLDRLGGTRISMFDTTTCQSTSRSTVPRANEPPATPCCRCCAITATCIAFRWPSGATCGSARTCRSTRFRRCGSDTNTGRPGSAGPDAQDGRWLQA